MYALALSHETLADAIAEALAPARAAQVRSGVLGGTCLVCGGVTRIAAHAGVRSDTRRVSQWQSSLEERSFVVRGYFARSEMIS